MSVQRRFRVDENGNVTDNPQIDPLTGLPMVQQPNVMEIAPEYQDTRPSVMEGTLNLGEVEVDQDVVSEGMSDKNKAALITAAGGIIGGTMEGSHKKELSVAGAGLKTGSEWAGAVAPAVMGTGPYAGLIIGGAAVAGATYGALKKNKEINGEDNLASLEEDAANKHYINQRRINAKQNLLSNTPPNNSYA
jgi:hypothetical protein